MSFDFEKFSAEILANRADWGLVFLDNAQRRNDSEAKEQAVTYARETCLELERVLAVVEFEPSDRQDLLEHLETLSGRLAAMGYSI